jgi:serine/threonine protein kinase
MVDVKPHSTRMATVTNTERTRRSRSLDISVTYEKSSEILQRMEEMDVKQLGESIVYLPPREEMIYPSMILNEQKIGQGAFCDISLCVTTMVEHGKVIVKRLNRHRSNNSIDVSKFIREIRMMYWIRSQNGKQNGLLYPIGWFTASEKSNSFFIVLPWMSNGDLYHYIKQNSEQSVSYRKKLQWCLQMSKALHFLHQRGYVHCDFKSLNLLLDNNLDLYLTDFSELKHESYFATEDKESLQPHGTIFWMSPEMIHLHHTAQISNRYRVTHRTDIYSMAIVLYEIFTWSKPYDAYDALTVLEKMKERETQFRMSIPHNVPPEIARIIEQCWNSNPELRPSSEQLISLFSKMLKQISDD